MTQYHTACGTGTHSGYYTDYCTRNSTTVIGTDYDDWYRGSTTATHTEHNILYYKPVQTTTYYSYIEGYTGTADNFPYIQRENIQNKPSEQDLLRQREERVKAEEAAKRELEETAKAEEKARFLLLEYLDNENIQRFLDKKPLEVPSRLFGDIKYHIPMSNGRIKAWKESKVVTELCLSVKDSGYLPTSDIVLTKLLHILHDEENVLRTANHFDKKENLLARLN
jgi:hypothetical protein